MVKKSSSSKSTKSNSKASEIYFIRLNNGEDIVAEVMDISNGRMKINNPLKILYTPSVNTGFLSISLMQWVFTKISTNQTFDIDCHNILIMTESDKKLREHYMDSLNTFNVAKQEDDDTIDFDTLQSEEGVEMLKSLMDKIKGRKRGLH